MSSFKIFIGILFLGPLLLPAQPLTGTAAQDNLNNLVSGAEVAQIYVHDNRSKEVIGHPYFHNDFLPGTLITKNGFTYKDIRILYDLMNDNVIVQSKKIVKPIIIPRSSVASFTCKREGIPFEFERVDFPQKKGEKIAGYGQVLVAGKVRLIKKREKYFIEADKSADSYSVNVRPEYKSRQAEYYVEREGVITGKLKKSLKGITSALPDHADEIKSYIKKEKLVVAQEKDLIRIIEYYNQR